MMGRRNRARGGPGRRGARCRMEIVLHLGAHRTGTTTLQDYLRRHRPGLAARGIRPLLPAALRGPEYRGLVQRNGGGPARQALAATIARARGQGMRVLLLSEENLCGDLRATLAAGRPYPGLAARLARLGPLPDGGPRRVGLAVRPYAGWWESVLAYAVAQGLHVPDGAEGARLSAARRGWADVVADIARAFPGAEIVVWHGLAGRPHLPVQALTGIAGLPPGGSAPRRNAAADAAVLRARLVAAGRGDAARHLPQTGRWRPFTPVQARDLAARHAADLARIARMASVRLIAAPPHSRQAAPGLPCAPHPPDQGADDGRCGQVA